MNMESKIREVSPGIYQLYLPLPMRPSIVNIYLVHSRDEWALIDTGMHSEDSIATLKACLEEVGCPPSSVRKLISTHHHADHFGASRAHKEWTGAEVYLNPIEIQRMERMQSSSPSPEAIAFFRSHGIPLPESGDGLPAPGRYFGTLYAPATPDHHINDGDVIYVGEREIQIVWTPGHTAGHCCLYFPQDKVMIVGDHLLPKITPHVGVYYSGPDNPLLDFLQSQEKVQQFDVELVLPAHGAVFKDHRYRAKQIIQHHKYRLQEIQDAAVGHARTACEIAKDVFDLGKEPSIFQLMAATFETLAHLHLLMYENKVKRIEEKDKVNFIAT